MTSAIMHGCNGRMGRVISELVKEDDQIEIVAGVDVFDDGHNDYPVFSSMKDVTVKADVVIDFSNSAAVNDLLCACLEKQLPVVLCTTGISENLLEEVEKASKNIAILRSANMSLGVNLLMKLVKDAAATLQNEGFDIEIVEKHHRKKLDAPSGTAIALANAANDGLDHKKDFVFDRSQRREVRPDSEIGISAVRGGSITGEHDVIFAGLDEVLTLSHTAYSRDIFGKGAIAAAKFLAGKTSGYYSMADVIAEK